MNPWGAVAGQAGALAGLLTVLALTGTRLSVVVVTTMTTALAVVVGSYIIVYCIRLRGADAVSRTRRRKTGDLLAVLEGLGATIFPACALVAVELTDLAPVPSPPELEALLTGVAITLLFVLVSSFIDWFRILPARDGLVRVPPCMSSGREWESITKAWFRHRTIAESAFVVFPLAALATMLLLFLGRFDGQAAGIGKFVSLAVTIVGTLVKFSIGNVYTGGRAIRTRPAFALGDTISFKTPVEREPVLSVGTWELVRRRPEGAAGSRLFVMDVALDSVRLVRVEDAGLNGPEPPRPATRDLLRPGAIEERSFESPCLRAGRCLLLNEYCERRTSETKPRDDLSVARDHPES